MTAASVELSLLRHAHAGDPAKWRRPDAERPLSAKGRAQAERLSRFLLEHELRPDHLVSSPKVRAVQTAEPVAKAFDLPIHQDGRLGDPLDLATVEAILGDALGGERAAAGPQRVMLVGHDPAFSELLMELTGIPDLTMRKGTLARIDAARPLRPGGGTLVWLVPPQLLDPAG
ncbi:MAG TPA: histidine phosphatase family protein [Candidatus Sulfotelmatobacter sp.]|nr:histidine phosphatase family protein [Candidatus Sulfotelmatobacter sp.]